MKAAENQTSQNRLFPAPGRERQAKAGGGSSCSLVWNDGWGDLCQIAISRSGPCRPNVGRACHAGANRLHNTGRKPVSRSRAGTQCTATRVRDEIRPGLFRGVYYLSSSMLYARYVVDASRQSRRFLLYTRLVALSPHAPLIFMLLRLAICRRARLVGSGRPTDAQQTFPQ